MKKELNNKQLRELQKLGYKGERTIADLIEYLGNDLVKIKNNLLYTVWIKANPNFMIYNSDKLVDTLQEAVKYKLK